MSIAAGRPCDARRLYERTLKTAEDHPGPAPPLQRTFTWVWRTCFVRQGTPSRPHDTLAVAKELGEAASLPGESISLVRHDVAADGCRR